VVSATPNAERSVIRTHRYVVAEVDLPELIARRARLIKAVRSRFPGLSEARLARLPDGTLTDAWRWASAIQMHDALAAVGDIPGVGATMAMLDYESSEDSVIIDEL
jgi:hypothetical protein